MLKQIKYFKTIVILLLITGMPAIYAQQPGQQQITLNEQQVRELANNPELLKQYGISKQQLLDLAAQNGLNLQDQDATERPDPKQFSQLSGKSENSLLRNGNKEYDNEDFVEAEINYRKSLEKNPERVEGLFNLGNALYAQNRFDEAFEKYNSAASIVNDKKTQAEAFHNLGNSYLQGQKLNEAIDAFKSALKLNPEDEDSRYNLAYANFLKKKQQKQQEQDKNCNNPNENKEEGEKKEKDQKKDQKQKEEKDKKEQEEKKEQQEKQDKEESKEEQQNDKNKKEEQEKKEEEEQQQDQAREDNKKEEQDKKEEQKPKPDEQKAQDQQKQEQQLAQAQLSKQEAERLLEALENEEKKVQQKLLKQSRPAVKRTIEKDW